MCQGHSEQWGLCDDKPKHEVKPDLQIPSKNTGIVHEMFLEGGILRVFLEGGIYHIYMCTCVYIYICFIMLEHLCKDVQESGK